MKEITMFRSINIFPSGIIEQQEDNGMANVQVLISGCFRPPHLLSTTPRRSPHNHSLLAHTSRLILNPPSSSITLFAVTDYKTPLALAAMVIIQ